MPPRVSRSSISKFKPKTARKKSQKRSLQAFSIAEAQNPEAQKIRKHRLGDLEDDGLQRKRQRFENEDELDSENESQPSKQRIRKKAAKSRSDELDVSEGSDSEGNRWKLGVVNDEDDSEVDSDEAFGSSDEERFAGSIFRGSSSNKNRPKKTVAKVYAGNFDLKEAGNAQGSDDDGSLGEDAVDLATMLDTYEGSDEDSKTQEVDKRNRRKEKRGRDVSSVTSSLSEEVNDGASDASSESISDMEEPDDEDQIARLQDLVSVLQPVTKTEKKRQSDPHEARAPTASGLVSAEKFDINDFITSDPQIKRMSRLLGTIPQIPKKDPKLAASLPKRQKDKLDRVAANEKAKATLNRWLDTVKHNRRADHLMFPLQQSESANSQGSRVLLPTNQSAPMNDLEIAIHSILQESGLANGNSNQEEERIRAFEELKTNKMPLEEVQARRAELRKARDLLFREEIRAKRVNKIKSKAYRRVHRKEREKMSALDRDAFAEGGAEDMDDEDRDRADRRRAEERMGAKHRDSKWAKQMKKSGRSVWDEDAKSGVSEMAQRNEELRKRIEGKELRAEDGSDMESAFDTSDEDVDLSDIDVGVAEFQSLQRQLDRVERSDQIDDTGPGGRLHSMKFMRLAEAARKARNDEDIARIRKELASDDEDKEAEEEESIGRKIFGPTKKLELAFAQPEQTLNEFEAPLRADDEWIPAGDEPVITGSPDLKSAGHSGNERVKIHKLKDTKPVAPRKGGVKLGGVARTEMKHEESTVELLPGEKHSQPDTDGWITVNYDAEVDDEENQGLDTDQALDQAEILRRAFAGDDVEAAFEEEKNAITAEEDDKIIDDTIPGWGSWVGEGLSKREQQRNYGRVMRKEEGIKPAERKDAKLKHVIVNQKRVKKNVAYMASSLPFPFTTKTEYERSIRMPIGAEWNAKETFQANTTPRVLVRPGSIIKPMERPIL